MFQPPVFGSKDTVASAGIVAELLIADNNLSPAQAFNIQKRAGLKVIDRSELILDAVDTLRWKLIQEMLVVAAAGNARVFAEALAQLESLRLTHPRVALAAAQDTGFFSWV